MLRQLSIADVRLCDLRHPQRSGGSSARTSPAAGGARAADQASTRHTACGTLPGAPDQSCAKSGYCQHVAEQLRRSTCMRADRQSWQLYCRSAAS